MARRPVTELTDWIVPTPTGTISPRSMRSARALREHAEEIREAIRQGGQ